jgi:cell wall-associated NlpC family hydrolase
VGGAGVAPVGPDGVEATAVEGRSEDPASPTDADEPVEASPHPIAARAVQIALESIGTPYEWGGSDGNGFDCSGLIRFAYGKLGIEMPRQSTAQLRAGRPVDPVRRLLRAGDLLGFSEDRGGKTGHVGLYVGGGEFIHSSSRGVRVSTLGSRYWQDRLVVARRIVE